jgi:peptide/nickel transport system substrate-binding protein
MNDRDLRALIGRAKAGSLSRRALMRRLAALGLAAPAATQLLAQAGVAMAQSKTPVYKPTRRGGGGPLKLMLWQAPTLLNPHFATGNKDREATRMFYEPLAGWDNDGNLRPALAAAIPGREDGTLSPDGKSVTWKLKQGVTWHDGRPFTADDVVFTWEYAKNAATATVTTGSYRDVVVEKLDLYTVVVKFAQPTPFWADAFVGGAGMIIPKHVFADYAGARSREAPANLMPVGTGPYKCTEFKPGDMVAGVLNPAYHLENRPYFDSVVMKGGGDAVSAARTVLQTGEYDFAWNLQVEDEILVKMEKGGKGRIAITNGGGIEHIRLQSADPWTEIDGERASLKTRHPTLSDPAVRQALALLVDKASIEKFIYGRTGRATANYVDYPERFRSKNTSFEFNVDKANELLDKAGWKKGADGIREMDGKKLKFVFQTSINQPRQKTQAIVKQACQKAGIDIEVKAITASVYFSSDVANPDTGSKFYADLEMHTSYSGADPEVFMRQFCSWQANTKANKWLGTNSTRWQSKEYDDTYKAAQVELDPVKRAALLIRCNDLVVNNQVVIPVVSRPDVSAVKTRLVAELSGWDSNTWDLASWYMES